ncbi:MAG TPA: single-stranded DNA-binding protein [Candidatus Levybacteria bacterium]|nr:single-stranded DNA-binding protein [Candidatus Levybacteria bacterium]
MARSLNRVELIGNLTRDPELRYTPQGTAVCTIGIATNRTWQTENGEKKEDVEFHRVIAWNKLAELCSQLLTKGRKVYVEGRLQTRSWTAQDGAQKSLTEIVINDMLILDSKRSVDASEGVDEIPEDEPSQAASKPVAKKKEKQAPVEEEINPDDIPF